MDTETQSIGGSGMKYLLLFTTLIFAGELEVDGDLKVTGTVDASGNPITNVGAAHSHL
jgi:hypothetical protein